jgi:hypothetical protein
MRTRFFRALAVIAVVACSDSTAPVSATLADLTAAKSRWAASAPASYQYTFSRSCFCGPESARLVVVTVRNGVVESARYADTGALLAPAQAAAYPTIEGVFALVDDALARHADSITAEYDAARGYPVRIFIDWFTNAVADEMGYGVRDFVAL